MSKERELLRDIMETGMLTRGLTMEIGQLLAQPEPAPIPQRAPMTQREAYQRGYEAARKDYKQKLINAFGVDDD